MFTVAADFLLPVGHSLDFCDRASSWVAIHSKIGGFTWCVICVRSPRQLSGESSAFSSVTLVRQPAEDVSE